MSTVEICQNVNEIVSINLLVSKKFNFTSVDIPPMYEYVN